MNSITRKIMSAAIGGIGLAALLTFAGQESTLLIPNADAEGKKWKYFGASTCGGGSCHAASKPEANRPANEYTTWSKKDNHAKAFNRLFEEASTEMCEELEIEDASKDKRCTVCHSTDVPKELQGDKYNNEDGVSCDGCHGPAEGWFKPHTKPHKYEDMLKLGMWDTRNIWRRADVCVKCHLQIEPELVDAGHPDLSFEIYAHSRREPPHWYERQTWDGIRAWSVGQAVSLREALLKISKRIKGKKDFDTTSLALYQAQSYVMVFKHGVAVFGSDADKKAIAGLDKMIAGALDAEKIADGAAMTKACDSAAELMNKLGQKLAKADSFNAGNVKSLFKAIASDKALMDADGIDEFVAEQAAGALYALYNSSKQGKGPRNKGEVETPDAIEKILVRPTVYKPDDLFDDEGTFLAEKWIKRYKAAGALVK